MGLKENMDVKLYEHMKFYTNKDCNNNENNTDDDVDVDVNVDNENANDEIMFKHIWNDSLPR